MFLVAAQVLRSHSSHSDSIQALLLPMHLIIKSVMPSSASLLHHRKAAIELLPGFWVEVHDQARYVIFSLARNLQLTCLVGYWTAKIIP